jgi:hypothetical protein
MSVRVRRPPSPVLAIATSTLIQSAVAVLRIHAHEISHDPAGARAAAPSETTIIAVLATLVTTDAKYRVG